jgi:hypothetical protein
MKKRIILLLVLVCGESILMAMPTREEIAKARPLVQELMRKDVEAGKQYEKTLEQVGDAGCTRYISESTLRRLGSKALPLAKLRKLDLHSINR